MLRACADSAGAAAASSQSDSGTAAGGHVLYTAQHDRDANVRCAALDTLCSTAVWELSSSTLAGALLWSTANDESKAVRYYDLLILTYNERFRVLAFCGCFSW
jgi:hypothetical protein